eukprot:CAMPEP_0185756874 /NCGR_PEP_ID=MMETSP1174-20130828/15266_1 /TAXON_ID=35687 /ORGANISM="Dictyocha speculum, Strain CCMP1381" /LENGTH=99 /DNA_ID=CAMNT_0028436013 /DNA_START=189 /DNA_END=488 /DNA_ORIENTATION=+
MPLVLSEMSEPAEDVMANFNSEFAPAQAIEWVLGLSIYAAWKNRIGPEPFLALMDKNFAPRTKGRVAGDREIARKKSAEVKAQRAAAAKAKLSPPKRKR